LSASISIGMNCTAFGLMVAIPLVLVHSMLQTKTTEIIDSLEMASVKFLNAITERASGDAGPAPAPAPAPTNTKGGDVPRGNPVPRRA
jgi:biopolymer transport protein ExbB